MGLAKEYLATLRENNIAVHAAEMSNATRGGGNRSGMTLAELAIAADNTLNSMYSAGLMQRDPNYLKYDVEPIGPTFDGFVGKPYRPDHDLVEMLPKIQPGGIQPMDNSRALYEGYIVNIRTGDVIWKDEYVGKPDEQRIRMQMAISLHQLTSDESEPYDLDDFDFVVRYIGSVRPAPKD
jgi:hypothetical protein